MPVYFDQRQSNQEFNKKLAGLASQIEEYGEKHPQMRIFTRPIARLGPLLVPDPYNPASYIFPIGLTKLKGAKQIVKPFFRKDLPPQERESLISAIRAWYAAPEKGRNFISRIVHGPEKFSYYSKRHLHLGKARTPDEEAIFHEVEHAMQDLLIRKYGTTLDKAYQRRNVSDILEDFATILTESRSKKLPEKIIEKEYTDLAAELSKLLD